MFDFVDWLINNRNKPLDYIILAGIIFIADRVGRNFITHQVKRLFHIDDKSVFKEYIHNQHLIMERLGIPYDTKHIVESPKKSIAKSLKILLKSSWELIRRMKNVRNINKGILLPLLSAIALFVKQVWGIELNDEQINMYADLILYAIMFIGLFIQPRKEKKKDDQLDFTDGPAA